MSEEEKKEKKSFDWFKNIISAIVGALISFLATFGLIGKSDADLAKEKMNSWLNKSKVVYEQVASVQATIAEVKQLLADKKYLEALSKLDGITDNAKETIATVKELKAEIEAAVKAVKEQAETIKENAKDKIDEVKETVQDVKDAVKPEDEEGGN